MGFVAGCNALCGLAPGTVLWWQMMLLKWVCNSVVKRLLQLYFYLVLLQSIGKSMLWKSQCMLVEWKQCQTRTSEKWKKWASEGVERTGTKSKQRSIFQKSNLKVIQILYFSKPGKKKRSEMMSPKTFRFRGFLIVWIHSHFWEIQFTLEQPFWLLTYLISRTKKKKRKMDWRRVKIIQNI